MEFPAEAAAAKRPNILWLIGENLSPRPRLLRRKERPHAEPRPARRRGRALHPRLLPRTRPARRAARRSFTGMYQTTTDTHPMRSHRNDDFRLPRRRAAGHAPAPRRGLLHRQHQDRRRTASAPASSTSTSSTKAPSTTDLDDWSALKSHQPFFAVVNADEAEYDIYDRQSAQKDRVEWVGEREHVQHATPENVTPPPYYPDHPVVRQEWARYPELRLRHGPAHRPRAGTAARRRPGGRHRHHFLRRQRPPGAARHPLVLRQRPARADDHQVAEEFSRAAAGYQPGTVRRPDHQPDRRHRHHAGLRRRAASAAHAGPRLPRRARRSAARIRLCRARPH